ncbi:hypothetical protein IL306_005854 [Fusarium sp. DS 682]|nr:hypothetical protein IL306_005854 [Fusarium sp. DS 682]
MATGRFALPNIDPSPQNSNACFNDSTQSSAWSCDIVIPIWSIQIDNDTSPQSNSSYNLTLKAINDKETPFPWGAQPPSITQPAPMVLVNDTLEIARGPAWWLRTKYNKTVIVSEKKFGDLSKRGWDDDYEDYNSFHRFKNKPVNAKVGDKPWICTWPDTVIEFFIYPGENSSTYHPPPATTTVYEDATTTYSTYSSSSTPEWNSWKQPLPIFPHVYKMVERRFLWGEESVATCTQYKIIGDGTQKEPVMKDGKKVVMVIIEDENEDPEALNITFTKRSDTETKKALRQLLKRTNPSLTDCGCSWTSL